MFFFFFLFFWGGGGGGVIFAILKVKLLHFFLFLFCMVNLIEKKGETLSIRDAHKGSPKECAMWLVLNINNHS